MNMDPADTVPSFFICPISLEIVKDPVTVSTGMTFDRESIEKWIFSYQRIICPITRQPLSDFNLIPNSNLLRLIQSWHLHQEYSSIKFTEVEQNTLHDDESLQLLLQDIKQPHSQGKSLRSLKSVIQEKDGYRNSCLGDGLFSVLASLLVAKSESPTGISESRSTAHDTLFLIDEVVSLLCLLHPSDDALKTVSENGDGLLIELFCSILMQYMSTHVRIQVAILLKSMFKVVEDIYKAILKEEFFASIIDILKDQNSKRGTMTVLSILMEVLGKGKNKEKAINGGLIPVLVELLAESKEKQVCEVMLVVLEKLCRKAEGRATFLAHPMGMGAVLSKILRVSHVGNERAVSLVLWVFRF